jgi:hypothetical protein
MYCTVLLVLQGIIFVRCPNNKNNYLRAIIFCEVINSWGIILGCYWAFLPSSGCLWKLLLLLVVLLLEDGKHTVLQEFALETAAPLPSSFSPGEA